ncbi:MAG: lipopolysaccharide heptosyltransferase II [Chlamydia sp.]
MLFYREKRGKQIDPKEISSLIIRCPNWIGDAVMATPLLQELRTLFPHARFTGVSHQTIADLYQESPFFDDFISVSRKKEEKRAANSQFISQLQKIKPDLGILLTNSFSSAWLLYRGKVAQRLGFTGRMRRPFLTHPVPKRLDESACHDVEQYRKLLKPIIGSSPDSKSPQMRLSVSFNEKIAMKQLLEKNFSTTSDYHRIILINPGAAYGSAKCWPLPSFRAVIELLLEEKKNRIFILGDQSMLQLGRDVTHGFPPSVQNLAGKTALRELMALISLANVTLSNDSGPMHIASALDRPLVALFGSTDPYRTGPFNGGKVLYKQTLCSPCYLRKCPIDFRCMTAISVHEVHQALTDLFMKEKRGR